MLSVSFLVFFCQHFSELWYSNLLLDVFIFIGGDCVHCCVDVSFSPV